ncbi:MAG: CBS domain-containing protein, partial [Nitrospira sp.]|nr:CBS domain-containing protein [Nitrospira sp.]
MTMQSGSTVGHFMHRYLEVVPPETTIVEAAERMKEQRLGSLLVESTDAEGRMTRESGIVT